MYYLILLMMENRKDIFKEQFVAESLSGCITSEKNFQRALERTYLKLEFKKEIFIFIDLMQWMKFKSLVLV